MKIVPYSAQYRQAYVDFNTAWIKKWFVLEPADVEVLEHVEDHIAAGGMVFFALDQGVPVCTALIEPMVGSDDPGEWELNKLAANPDVQGTGAGSAVVQTCIDYAREHGATRITLVSNTALEPAQHLYRKFGFVQVPMRDATFERANIQYDLLLDQ